MEKPIKVNYVLDKEKERKRGGRLERNEKKKMRRERGEGSLMFANQNRCATSQQTMPKFQKKQAKSEERHEKSRGGRKGREREACIHWHLYMQYLPLLLLVPQT